MIQTGSLPGLEDAKSDPDTLNSLEMFLEKNTEHNKTERWNKLDRTLKLRKVNDFIQDYTEKNNLTDEENRILFDYLKDCLDKKKIMRVKDVVYDNDNDKLVEICGLHFDRSNKKFTIKNTDSKKSSILRGLPKKTVKNKNRPLNKSSSKNKKPVDEEDVVTDAT
tara:strand:- start:1069 stop:1563 length:495 start_codon:yes stop_codon:yes gene_type:complete